MRWNPRDVLELNVSEQSGDRLGGPVAVLARTRRPVDRLVETAGFWTAVLLPLCYVPLLLTGLSTGRDAALLGLLVVLHLVALTAGHAHNRS
jgi:hypothetical protein